MSLLGLVVHHAFGGFSAGQIITDAEQMAKAIAEYPAHVVRRVLTDAEAEAAKLEADAKAKFQSVVHGAEPEAAPTIVLPEAPALKA